MQKRRAAIRTFYFITTFASLLIFAAACNSFAGRYQLPDIKDVTSTPIPPTPSVTVSDIPNPSPSEPTAAPTPLGPLTAPLFSAEGGFYDHSFTLTLSTTGSHDIYFTLDGSDPRTSETAMFYHTGINIYNNTNAQNRYSALTDITLYDYTPPTGPVDKGIIIRAVSKAPDGTYSDVVTNSYFVEKKASYYNDMKVISLVTDSSYLFDPNHGAYMVGTEYYTWFNSDSYTEYDEGDTRNPTNYNKDGKEAEFPVTIQVFEQGHLVYTADVGARISGNWSRAAAQKSFRLYARKEYGKGNMNYAFFDDLTADGGALIKKFDKITIRNSGNDHQTLHFRDAFIQELVTDLSCDTMASEPCILFIDGEFWGFYLLREKPDGDYIESHYGIPKEEVAVIKNGGIETGTEEDLMEFHSFCKWAQSADMTNETNYTHFCETMDVQNFMDYMTVETYVNNADWANGGLNNWMVWHSKIIDPNLPKADGKWRFIFYDLDMSAGLYRSKETSHNYDSLNTIYTPSESFNLPAMLRNLMKNDTFRQAFYENYLHIIDTTFAPKVVQEKITEYVEAYADATIDTFYRFGLDWAATNYSTETALLRNFFNNRPAYAKKYLADFCTTAEKEQDNLLPSVDFWTFYGPASYLADTTEYAFHVNVPEATEHVWDIQSQANHLTLEPYVPYTLTFEASCTTEAEFDIGFNRYDGSDYPSCWWTTAILTPELQEYSFVIVTDGELFSDWRLCFNFGNASGDYMIKNARLSKMTSEQLK